MELDTLTDLENLITSVKKNQSFIPSTSDKVEVIGVEVGRTGTQADKYKWMVHAQAVTYQDQNITILVPRKTAGITTWFRARLENKFNHGLVQNESSEEAAKRQMQVWEQLSAQGVNTYTPKTDILEELHPQHNDVMIVEALTGEPLLDDANAIIHVGKVAKEMKKIHEAGYAWNDANLIHIIVQDEVPYITGFPFKPNDEVMQTNSDRHFANDIIYLIRSTIYRTKEEISTCASEILDAYQPSENIKQELQYLCEDQPVSSLEGMARQLFYYKPVFMMDTDQINKVNAEILNQTHNI